MYTLKFRGNTHLVSPFTFFLILIVGLSVSISLGVLAVMGTWKFGEAHMGGGIFALLAALVLFGSLTINGRKFALLGHFDGLGAIVVGAAIMYYFIG